MSVTVTTRAGKGSELTWNEMDANFTGLATAAPYAFAEQYGAKGDGVTDDSTALQSAITAVPTGGTLYLTPGKTYYITGYLTLHSDMTVDGNGAKIKASSTTGASNIFYTGTTMLSNIILKNMHLESTMDKESYWSTSHVGGQLPTTHRTSNRHFIGGGKVTNLFIDNVVMTGADVGVKFDTESYNITVSNVIMSNCLGHFVLNGCDMVHISHTHVTQGEQIDADNLTHHFYMTDCTNVYLDNVTTRGGAFGTGSCLQFNHTTLSSMNLVISNCDFVKLNGNFVNLVNIKDVSISNTKISVVGAIFYLGTANNNISVDNCQIASGYLALTTATVDSPVQVSDVVFTNCIIGQSTGNTIQLSGIANLKIANSTFTNGCPSTNSNFFISASNANFSNFQLINSFVYMSGVTTNHAYISTGGTGTGDLLIKNTTFSVTGTLTFLALATSGSHKQMFQDCTFNNIPTLVYTASDVATNVINTTRLMVSKSANYTLKVEEDGAYVTGTTTITLPTAIGKSGKIYTIKNAGVGTVTVDTTSSQTIDGATTYSLPLANSVLQVISDGANWSQISQKSLVAGTDYLTPSGNGSSLTGITGSQITQDATHRFATDTEKSTWNGKQSALTAQVDYIKPDFTTTATSGGTTTLTSSATYYNIFTGTQNHTVQLPAANTLALGRKILIDNDSTQSITVKDGGSNDIWILAPGTDLYLTCSGIATAAGTWEKDYAAAKATSGLALTIDETIAISTKLNKSGGTMTGNILAPNLNLSYKVFHGGL